MTSISPGDTASRLRPYLTTANDILGNVEVTTNIIHDSLTDGEAAGLEDFHADRKRHMTLGRGGGANLYIHRSTHRAKVWSNI